MSTVFEKIASEFEVGQALVDNIVKVASEEVSTMDAQEVANQFFAELEASGVNLEDPTVQAEVDALLTPEALYQYGTDKVAEYVANDIYTAHEKVSGEESICYETAAASKAVAPFLTNDGIANFGSAFGQGNGAIGSVVNANTDKNVFGGWGTLIGKNTVNPRAVNASGKVGALLGSTNQKMASAEEVENAFKEALEKSAEDAGLSLDNYVYNLGFEAIVNSVKESYAPEGKVASFFAKNEDIHSAAKTELAITKEAADVAINWIEDEAATANMSAEDFVLNIGFEKAAEYFDEAPVEEVKTAGIAKDIKEKISLNPVKNAKTMKEYLASKREKKEEKNASELDPTADVLAFAKAKLGVK